MKRRFIQCDVFSRVPARGNGLAVVLDSDGLSTADMQAFAAWTNLAETTFLAPPSDPAAADYAVRIFTPQREMPFAGHPTLGSCMSWLHAGGRPAEAGRVRQECGVGIVEIDVTGAVPAFVAPPTNVEPLPDADRAAIVQALGLDPERIVRTARLTNGPVWQVFELQSAADVLAVDSARVRWLEFRSIGLIGPHAPGGECDCEVRMIATSSGMSEDPITGSLNAAIARWMQAEGRLDRPLAIAQGTTIGRVGRVSIRTVEDAVMIGGAVQILVEGTLEL